MFNVYCLMIKELEIMKTLRYLLMVMVVAIASVTAQAQPRAQFKTSENKAAFEHQVGKAHFEFYSTSTMMESGSRLPLAARNGLTIGANTPDDNTPSGGVSGPRRAKMDDFDDDDISGTGKPQEPGSPVGEGMWVLLLMAMGYVGYRKWREWRSIPCAQ